MNSFSGRLKAELFRRAYGTDLAPMWQLSVNSLRDHKHSYLLSYLIYLLVELIRTLVTLTDQGAQSCQLPNQDHNLQNRGLLVSVQTGLTTICKSHHCSHSRGLWVQLYLIGAMRCCHVMYKLLYPSIRVRVSRLGLVLVLVLRRNAIAHTVVHVSQIARDFPF